MLILHKISSVLRRGRIGPVGRRIIQTLNVSLPLALIHSLDSPIVRHQTVHLTLNIRRLSPHPRTAGVQTDLILELGEQKVAAIIPSVEVQIDLIGLVDAVDGFLVVPKTVAN